MKTLDEIHLSERDRRTMRNATRMLLALTGRALWWREEDAAERASLAPAFSGP